MTLTPKVAALSGIATLVYLGLAVLGSGGFAAFFSHPPLTVVAIATIVMTVVAAFSSGNLSSGERENRDNRWVLAAFGAIGFAAAYLPALTDRLNVWTLDGETLRWAGVALYVAGGVLRIWPVFVLGKRFSGLVAIQPGHTLVTDGIYRRIRNPSYLGLLVNSVGWALAFRSGVGVLLVVLTMIRRSSRVSAPKRRCCARNSAPSTTRIARGPGGCCPACTDPLCPSHATASCVCATRPAPDSGGPEPLRKPVPARVSGLAATGAPSVS